jgi:phosphatidylglycerophosphate synthase
VTRRNPTGLLLIPDAQCLVEVARLPLLHRALLSGHKAGIHEWLLCTWYDAPRIHASLQASKQLGNVSWQVYDMQETDATSLARALPPAEVLVVTCTAVFDHVLLHAMQEGEDTVLGVTTTDSAMADGMSEGVVLQNGQVIATTAATPVAFQSIGVLRSSGELLGHIISEAWDTLPSSLAPLRAILPSLIARTRVKALDLSQHLWMPLQPPCEASVATAEARLLRRLGREGDSLIVRAFDRRISQALTKRLVHTRLTPNQITLISALIGLSGAFLLAQPSYGWQILGSLLFLLSTITDGCDGEIARLTFRESAFGAKLDLIMDNVVHLFLFPCIALGLYRQQHEPLYLLLGALALGGVFVSMAVFLPYVLRQRHRHSRLTRIHDSLASRDFAYLLPLLALLKKLHWFLWATAVGTYVFAAAWTVIAWRERRRQIRTLLGEESSSV